MWTEMSLVTQIAVGQSLRFDETWNCIGRNGQALYRTAGVKADGVFTKSNYMNLGGLKYNGW